MNRICQSCHAEMVQGIWCRCTRGAVDRILHHGWPQQVTDTPHEADELVADRFEERERWEA